jgi:hypothetical protein
MDIIFLDQPSEIFWRGAYCSATSLNLRKHKVLSEIHTKDFTNMKQDYSTTTFHNCIQRSQNVVSKLTKSFFEIKKKKYGRVDYLASWHDRQENYQGTSERNLYKTRY